MKRTFLIAAAVFFTVSIPARAQRSLASIFRTWGFVGDSMCSGEMECYEPGDSTVRYIDLYEYSWGQQLCRLTGSEGWNFSHGGQTARGWLREMDGERGWGYAQTHPKQAYIVALGANDIHQFRHGNPRFSLESYRENMKEIIRRLKSIQPDARFFVLTRPKETPEGDEYDEWNDVARSLPSEFSNLYVIDMYNDAPIYDDEFKHQYYMNGHLSPAGYLWTAWYLMDAIDAIIRSDPDAFRDIALIGTQWRAKP